MLTLLTVRDSELETCCGLTFFNVSRKALSKALRQQKRHCESRLKQCWSGSLLCRLTHGDRIRLPLLCTTSVYLFPFATIPLLRTCPSPVLFHRNQRGTQLYICHPVRTSGMHIATTFSPHPEHGSPPHLFNAQQSPYLASSPKICGPSIEKRIMKGNPKLLLTRPEIV